MVPPRDASAGNGPAPDAVIPFIFEMAQLRRMPRSGWRLLGVEHPENVAEHSLRAAQLAYLLAHMEGHDDPHGVVTRVVFHDMAEARTTDLDRVADRYVQRDEAAAVDDQTAALGAAGAALRELWHDVEDRDTEAGRIAKDAEVLEMVFTAKEYIALGHSGAQDWVDNTGPRLRTESARWLFAALKDADPDAWWRDLKVRRDEAEDA